MKVAFPNLIMTSSKLDKKNSVITIIIKIILGRQNKHETHFLTQLKQKDFLKQLVLTKYNYIVLVKQTTFLEEL